MGSLVGLTEDIGAEEGDEKENDDGDAEKEEESREEKVKGIIERLYRYIGTYTIRYKKVRRFQ